MVKGAWKVALSLLVVATQLGVFLPGSESRDLTSFQGGIADAEAILPAGGAATVANLSVPLSWVILNGTMAVSTLAGGAHPFSPAVDIAKDGAAEWSFDGTGYGAFGEQSFFDDGQSSWERGFPMPGNGTARLLLPKNATVQSATFDIEGFAAQRWWNTSWRSRVPITVKELSGKDQTPFTVETVLDTRNWTLGMAEREFRVTRVNPATLDETEVPIQVVDEIGNGSKCFEAVLIFAVQNLSARSEATFHLYFDNPGADRSALYRDFGPRLIKSRLTGQAPSLGFFGPVAGPNMASFDSAGNYYLADFARHCVFGYTRTFGRPDDPGSDGTRLRSPIDAVARPDGRIIVTDRDNYRVQVFDPDGSVAFTLGTTGVQGTDNSHFISPSGAGTDSEGNIYIADSGAHRVQIFDGNGSYLATIGEPGIPGTDNGHLKMPSGLAVSPSRDILVADTANQRVQAFKHVGGAGWSWNYTLGETGVTGTNNAHFNVPMDVALDRAGNSYIVDMANQRVQVFTKAVYRATIGMTGLMGPDNARLNMPLGAAVSPSGRIFVSDTLARRVQVFDSSYRYVQSLGSPNASGYTGPGSGSGALDAPGGVSVDGSGRIFVSDTNNHRVQVFGPTGDLLRTLGVTGTPGSDLSHFNYPRGLDALSNGTLLVADGGGTFPSVISNHRVLVFFDQNDSAADGLIGVTGQSGNDSTHLNQPWDVSVNADGKVAVADKGLTLLGPPAYFRGIRVQIFNDLQDGAADYTYGSSGQPGMDPTHLNFPQGVAETDGGWTYVADTLSNRIVLFKSDGDPNADSVLNPSGTPGTGPNQFRAPSDVDVDSAGSIFVADTGNHRVAVFNGAGAFQYMLGETGVNATDAFHLSGPAGVKLGDDDKLYIADSGNNRVLRITRSSLLVGAAERLSAPEGVALDLGADGTVDWARAGILAEKAVAADLAGAINSLLPRLPGIPDASGNEMARVVLALSNAGTGRVALSNLSISYDCTVGLSGLAPAVRAYVLAHAAEADASGNVSVPIGYSASSAGGVRLGNLDLTVDAPPDLLMPVPDRALDEDTANRSLYDFLDFFKDDFDARLDFSLVNLTNYTIIDVRLVNSSVLSVDCTGAAAKDYHGAIEFRVKATDSSGLSTLSGQVRVAVRPVNDPPVITSAPPRLAARVGTEWSHSAGASDVDGDVLIFSLDVKPDGMTINSSSGRIAWTPSAGDIGSHQVRLVASDGALSARQDFTVNVTAADATNHPPVITSTPTTVARTGMPYSYQVKARDDDNDRLSFALERSPAGMTIDNTTGLIGWTPQASQEGRHDVIVLVDDRKASASQEFTVTVSSSIADIAPSVNITAPAPGGKVRGTVLIKGVSSARNGTVESVELSVDLDGRWVAAEGKTGWTYRLDTTRLPNGLHTVYVRVRDSSGNFGQANITLDVQNVKASPPAANTLLGIPPWILLLAVVTVLAVLSGALALHRKRKGRATAGRHRQSATEAPAPPAVAAAPGESTMTAPGTSRTPAQGTMALASAPSAAASPSVPPSPPVPPPRPSPPVKAVDSVFLIYHDGRLITYFSRSESIKLDDTLDMIRKFVRASFSGQLGRLDSMRYENSNIIMERGNMMYMVVITPLPEHDRVRGQMRQLLEDIDNQYRVVFKIWDGDFNRVKGVKTMVERFASEEVLPDEPAEAAAPPHHPPPAPSSNALSSPPPYTESYPPPAPSPAPLLPPPPSPAHMPPPPSPQPYPQPPPSSQTAPPPEGPLQQSLPQQQSQPFQPAHAPPYPPPSAPAPPSPSSLPGPPHLAVIPRPTPSKAAPPAESVQADRDLDNKDEEEGNREAGAADRFDDRPPPPGKTSVSADPEKGPPEKVWGPLDKLEKSAATETAGEKKEPAPRPAATGLTDAERLQLLEDRFLRGEITELTYRELRDKLSKRGFQ